MIFEIKKNIGIKWSVWDGNDDDDDNDNCNCEWKSREKEGYRH